MLGQRASLDQSDQDGSTALMYASVKGRDHVAAMLLQAGASAGYSCLVKGALHGHPDSGGLLYEAADGTIKFARFPLSFE